MPLLSDEQIDNGLRSLSGWTREGDALRKQFKRRDFVGSVEFVNAIAPVAEHMNHHPDIGISWDTVTVTLSTHSQGGITENDIELAAKIDGLG
jgi:4a-hydroxytetrahydrobiopterin dehydratase